MIVIREDVNAMRALLRVQIAPADYQSKVSSALEKYRKDLEEKIPFYVSNLCNYVNTYYQ